MDNVALLERTCEVKGLEFFQTWFSLTPDQHHDLNTRAKILQTWQRRVFHLSY